MKGFLTIAQNGKHDYVKMAYLLALSLKISQKKHRDISIIVNNDEEIPNKYKKLFDQIIYIDKPKEDWKIQNKYQYYNLSPYKETIVLDCDMLFNNDIGFWWDYLENVDIEFTTNVRNYNNDVVTSDYYRKVFTNNDLPNIYTALFYFKKSDINKQFFKLVEVMFKNWKIFYEKFLNEPPKFLSGDVIYALAAKIFFSKTWNNPMSFIHMRSRLQDMTITEWQKELNVFFTTRSNKIQITVNNIQQEYPFHYIKKNFVTEEVVNLYEKTLRLL